MFKVFIISDSNKHFETPIWEYVKRLAKECEIVKIKPIKNWRDIQIIDRETDELIKLLEKQKWYKIVLNPKWKNIDTNELYNLVETKKQDFSNIIFIIWWANGIDYEKLKKYIHFELNLWKMTMPHSLALLVILEQIYRLTMRKKGTSYDK